jgi:hypothetical protein
MVNATLSLLLIGAPVLLIGIAMAFRRSLQSRHENAGPFRGYFAAIDDRYFLQHSNQSETEAWEDEAHSRFTPFDLREPGIDQFSAGSSRPIDQDHESY